MESKMESVKPEVMVRSSGKLQGLSWQLGDDLSDWLDTSLCSALLHTAALPLGQKGKQTSNNWGSCLCPSSWISAHILGFSDGNFLILSLIHGNCLCPSFQIHFICRDFHGLSWSFSGHSNGPYSSR